MIDAKNIAIEMIGIPILIIGILTIFTDWSLTKILVISFACGFIAVIVNLLTSKQTNQQSETPTAATPRKIPVKTIIGIVIVIAVIAIPLGIFFSIPGDTDDKIERMKSVIPREPKIPDIPVKCVDHLYDFRDDRIKTGQYIHTDINSEEHLIARTINKNKSATIYLALDKELQEKKVIAVKYIVEVSGNGQNAFGGFVKDSSYRKFTFNGQEIKFHSNKENIDSPCYPGIESGEYKITLTRVVSNDNKTAELRILVDPSFGEKYEKTETYDLFSEKNVKRVGLQFFSKNEESQLEISEIIISVSEN